MAQWNSTHGDIKKYIASEDELWSLSNYFFSEACKKTSTYKFGFIKAIMDSLFSGEMTKRGYELSFETLFSRFAENYWNLVTKYHLKQMRYNGSGELSSLELIFEKMVSKNSILSELDFSTLSMEDRKKMVAEVTNKCKKNVVGALYGNFDGLLYGFDIAERNIWLNPVAYEFLLKHKFELEKLNYYSWAKYLEKINDGDVLIRVLDKLDAATPKRKDLSVYREILRREFEDNTCFYCGKKIEQKIEVDHVIPWKLVREDRIWNFVLACKKCNTKKNDKIPEKRILIQIMDRNETLIEKTSPYIVEEMKGYSSELLMRLWAYAKIGGYKEFVNPNK